jgi:hypothetical protein
MIGAVELPLLPVGRDCDCGHPMVWRLGEQRCAVYGTHRPVLSEFVRDYNAPLANVVDVIDLDVYPAGRDQSRRRHLRAVEHLRAVG